MFKHYQIYEDANRQCWIYLGYGTLTKTLYEYYERKGVYHPKTGHTYINVSELTKYQYEIESNGWLHICTPSFDKGIFSVLKDKKQLKFPSNTVEWDGYNIRINYGNKEFRFEFLEKQGDA